MSTYTKNSGIEKPVPGSQEGTWGGTVNTNFEIIDNVLNGVEVISLPAAGTSGSPNTLNIADGSLSDGQNIYIEYTDGADFSSADVYVQLTEDGGTVDAEKVLWVKNSCDTGGDLYLFQGTYDAGRDYAIPNGMTAFVRFTGGGNTLNCYVYPILENLYVEGTFEASGDITGNNLSGTNTGDDPGVTSVDTSGALTGGPITAIGTITHLNTNGYKHIPSDGSSGEFVKWSAAGSGTWAAIATTDITGYLTPAMYDSGGTPTLTAGITQAEYRTAIGAGTSDTVGTVTQVDGGNGLTGSVTASGSLAVGAGTGILSNTNDVALNYAGASNFIRAATDLEGTAIATTDIIIYSDATDGNIKKGLISDLPGIGASGTVTSVDSGDGMDFTEITGAGTVTLGTPGSATASSTNAVTATSHTHAVDATIARIASPAFTGIPTAPTQTVGNSSTRLATTAFVSTEIANDAPLKDGTGATGTWSIDITGNAGTANSATAADTATSASEVTSAAQPNITSLGTLTDLTVTGLIKTDNVFKAKERAAADADTAAYGQIWVKTATPNQLYFTNDAGTDIRLDTTTTGTVTSVSAGNGLSFTTITTSGAIDLDYTGSGSFVFAATDGVVASADYILFYDVTDSTVKKDTVSGLPFTNNTGDITNVTAGNGLSGGGPSGSVTVTMGTPGTTTSSSTNAVTSTSHTHQLGSIDAGDITSGTLAVARGGTGVTSSTGTGNVVLSASPAFSGTVTGAAADFTGEVEAGSFNVSSARYLKDEVVGTIYEDGLLGLKDILYTLKSDTEKFIHMGYFADEVSPYFPQAVRFDDDGIACSVDYASLVVPIIKKLQQFEERLIAGGL